MARVGLTEAAKLTGKSPSTITRRSNHKDNKRRLGFTVNDDGDRLYDVTDLERMFGTLKSSDAPERTSARTSEKSLQSNDLHDEIKSLHDRELALMQDRIAQLEEQVEDVRKDRDEWRNEAKKHTLLLEDQRDKHKELAHILDVKEEERQKREEELQNSLEEKDAALKAAEEAAEKKRGLFGWLRA